MIRDYYHIYPTCPSCHEPHKSGVPLVRIDKTLFCPSCKVYFNPSVNLLASQTFKQTVDRIIADTCQGMTEPQDLNIELLSRVPLPWKIQPNQIEEEYVNWSCETPKGKFLITWPWNSVKFIPLLLSEYLIRNPGKRVTVVGRIHHSKTGSKHIPFPGVRDAFDSLTYLLDANVHPDDGIRHEMRRLGEKHVLKQSRTTQYRIDRRYSRSACNGDYPDSLKNSVAKLTAEISKGYGQNALRRTVTKTKKGPQINEYCEEGSIDLHLQEVESYMGKLRYRPEWLWDFLLNPQSVWRPKKQFVCSETDDAE